MALDRLTKITSPGIKTDTNWVGNNANFTGVTTTASSFNVGVTTIHSNLAELHNIKSTGIVTATGGSFSGNVTAVDGSFSGNVTAVDGTFSGNVSIAGTLTYEDVTNIDSVGIITAPALDVDDFISVGSNIHLGNAGVVTATSFVGDGSGLVGVASTDNIVTGTAATFTGGVDINSDLDVDGHTNLDNVSVAGVSTFSDTVNGTNLILSHTTPTIQLNDSNNNPDYVLQNNNGVFRIRDNTNSADRIIVNTDGHVDIGNLDVTGDLDVDGHTNLDNLSVAGVSTFTGAVNATNAVVGDFIDVGSNIKIGNAGVVTATSFVGDGSGLTGLISDKIFEGNTKAEVVDTGSNGYFIVETEGTERFRLDNVGDATFTGNLYIPDELVHSGDTDTRVRFPAADTFTVETSGTEALRIDSSGRVLIGTTAGWGSNVKLHLASSGNTYAVITAGTSSNSVLAFSDDGSERGSIDYDHNGDLMLFKTVASERLRIRSGGEVAIGGAGYAGQPFSVQTSGNNLGYMQSTGTTRAVMNFVDANSTVNVGYGCIGNNHVFMKDGAEKLRIDSSGKIGINQTSPYSEVDITSSVEDSTGTLSAHGIRLGAIGATDEQVIPITAGFKSQQDRARAGIGFISKISGSSEGYAGAIGFYTKSAADGSGLLRTNERVRIAEDGKIGIGHHIATQITKELTIRPANDGGILIGRPGDTVAPINSALLISTTTTGSEAYHTKWNTYNCNSIFTTYEGGGTGGNLIFKTGSGGGNEVERLRIYSDGKVQFSGTGGSAVNSAINRQVFEIGSLGGILLGSYDDARRATPADASTITGLRAPNILDWGLDRGDSSYQAGDAIPNSFNATWVNYNLNGSTTSNVWKIGQGPHGAFEWLWSGKSNDGSTGANGGFNTGFKIDPHYTYMFITYVKRVSSASGGNWYVGAGGNVADLGSGATSTKNNPYWTCGSTGNLSQNVWHVAVHYVRSYHSSNTNKLPNAGTYRMSDGSRIADGANCNIGNGMKFNTTSTGASVSYRSYLFYASANDGTELHWAQPHAYKCDGTEPTLMELLGRELANSDDSNNWDG